LRIKAPRSARRTPGQPGGHAAPPAPFRRTPGGHLRSVRVLLVAIRVARLACPVPVLM
jgi:hypothetical protein